MPALQCVACGRPVANFAGDVVIDRPEASSGDGVGRLKVVCHACHADPAVAERFHTMWGLAWLRTHYVAVTRRLLTGRAEGPERAVTGRAAEDFADLGYILLPGQEAAEDGAR